MPVLVACPRVFLDVARKRLVVSLNSISMSGDRGACICKTVSGKDTCRPEGDQKVNEAYPVAQVVPNTVQVFIEHAKAVQ